MSKISNIKKDAHAVAKTEAVFEHKDFGKIRVDMKLIASLSKFRQLAPHTPESGGVLIGKHLRSGGTFLVDACTVPQNEDHCQRNTFYRSHQHNQKVKEIWEKSGGRDNFLGLWHTHPEPYPSYSSVDLNDWKNALKSCKYYGRNLLFFIIGQEHLKIWIGYKGWFSYRVTELGSYCFDG